MEPKFIHGTLPSDGLFGLTGDFQYRPAGPDGQRLTGIVTITPSTAYGNPPLGVEYRLLVDGIPQPSMTIDTTQFLDGTHVLGIQVMNTNGKSVRNGSNVVIINNSGIPFTNLEGQAIVEDTWGGNKQNPNSLAWGRVDVLYPQAYPLDPELDKHPIASTDSLRQKCLGKVWWVDGFTCIPTMLWKPMPILMKNEHGDYFIKHWNPQGGGSGITPSEAQKYVEQAPACDGDRNISNVNPYASFNPLLDHPLESGQLGWIFVDKSGRVGTADITGEIHTILGPRSVGVGTDCDEMSVDLQDRLNSGEKEYVGDPNGLPLELPHDIWPCDLFPFEAMIADTGNDRVVEIMLFDHDTGTKFFKGGTLHRSWQLPGVTSVCASKELQYENDINMVWVAVNPEGLWCQRHLLGAEGENPTLSGGSKGRFIQHDPDLVKLADIPNAFWVRVLGTRIFVFTTDLGIYEYDALSGSITERLARRDKQETYVFAAIDYNGSIGPTERIYWGSASKKNGGYGSDKVTLFWLDPNTWEQGQMSKTQLLNRVVYGNWTSLTDPFGHYMWGVAIHPILPKFLTCGIVNSSWLMWTACLGEKPKPDKAIPYSGTKEFRDGKLDEYLGLSPIFGWQGHGQIGYTSEWFRNLEEYDSATVRAKLDPLQHPSVSEEDKEDIAKQVFEQRTRKHFPGSSPTTNPPSPTTTPTTSVPSTDPPSPNPLKVSPINGYSITGGTPPYTITDADGNSVAIEE